jgi:hypothetical protein
MLLASEGDIWHAVESTAREEGGIVAFNPIKSKEPVLDIKPRPAAIVSPEPSFAPTRSLQPEPTTATAASSPFVAGLVDHICTAQTLVGALESAILLLTVVVTKSKSLALKGEAAKLLKEMNRLLLDVQGEYRLKDVPYRVDVEAAGSLFVKVNRLVGNAMVTEGHDDVAGAAEKFSAKLYRIVQGPTCTQPSKKKRSVAWWLIPIGIGALGVVLWSEFRR